MGHCTLSNSGDRVNIYFPLHELYMHVVNYSKIKLMTLAAAMSLAEEVMGRSVQPTVTKSVA